MTTKVATLLSYLSADAGEPSAGAVDRQPNAEWPAVVESAMENAVGPLLYSRLQTLPGIAALPRDVLVELQASYIHNSLRSASLRAQLGELITALRQCGIPVIVLKGAHLAGTVYPDPSVRPMADLDLLTHSPNLSGAEHVLRDLGYRCTPGNDAKYDRHHHLPPYLKPGAAPVEIHSGIAPADAPFTMDMEAVWARAQVMAIGEVGVHMLSPEDLIQHLCVHVGFNHRFRPPLLRFWDIHAAVNHYRAQLDWELLVAMANAAGAGRLVHCTLRLVKGLLPATKIPENVLGELAHSRHDLETVELICAAVLADAFELPAGYQRYVGSRGLPSKVSVLAGTVFPPTHELRRIYRLRARSLSVYGYYLFRPVDLLFRRGSILFQIICQTKSMQPALEQERRWRRIDRWIEDLN